MITLTTTIQEITMQAYTFGVFNYLFEREHNAMSRDEIFNLFEKWGEEFEALEKEHEGEDDWFYYDEIDEFINKKYMELKLEDMFPYGIAVGDYITYATGLYKITGFSGRGILVDEIRPRKGAEEWIITEIGLSEAKDITLVSGEEIMDTANGHKPELVAKINIAWNEKREQFCPILRTLYDRDIKEIMDSDAWNWTDDVESVKETLHDEWDFHAYNYLMRVADDLDLKAILAFLRYEA